MRHVHKIFDPADGFPSFNDPVVVTDSTVAKRDGRWWMYLAGKLMSKPGIQLFSASLPPGAPLGGSGWTLTPDPAEPTRVAVLAPQHASESWDLRGGRHCPSYVRGWDPDRGAWVERLYYAGGAENMGGPYTIGYLEWDGARWVEQSRPAFVANEEWERGSVYEPNLVYADGHWKMWYVAGSNREGSLVHGFSESLNGRDGWSRHEVFFAAGERVFDFSVLETADGYEAVFSRVWLAPAPPPADTGLWWCRSATASSRLADWGVPVQILGVEPGWQGSPFKPCLRYSETKSRRMLVFFDGMPEKPLFPFALTLGCLEMDRPPI